MALSCLCTVICMNCLMRGESLGLGPGMVVMRCEMQHRELSKISKRLTFQDYQIQKIQMSKSYFNLHINIALLYLSIAVQTTEQPLCSSFTSGGSDQRGERLIRGIQLDKPIHDFRTLTVSNHFLPPRGTMIPFFGESYLEEFTYSQYLATSTSIIHHRVKKSKLATFGDPCPLSKSGCESSAPFRRLAFVL